MNKNSEIIKTAFILSIVGNSFLFALLIAYIFFGSTLNSFLFPNVPTALLSFAAIFVGPLVFGIVALSLLNKATPITAQDKVFRILTRIFSLIAIIEGCFFVIYYFLFLVIFGAVFMAN